MKSARISSWFFRSILIVGIAMLFTAAPAVVDETTTCDGVKLINQKCVPVGCFDGDAPGFPVTIARQGSYALSSNLRVPDENTTAIEITAVSVTLDLNGFTIKGPAVCSGYPWVCTPTGSGNGVRAGDNVTVMNGAVRGVGDTGIEVGRNSRVEKILAIGNAGNGIVTRTGGTVSGCTASENGRVGISVSEYSAVRDSLAHHNAGTGIFAGCVCSVIGCAATSNGGSGIYTGGTSACANNLACENDGDQIEGCTLMGENV
jgi:hypothetical protein